MSRFESLSASYVAAPLLEQHGEPIVYLPRHGPSKQINAIVHRELLEPALPGESPQYAVRIQVARSDIGDLNIGGDQVEVKRRMEDEDGTRMRIVEVLSQDGGLWELAVR